MAAGKKSSLVKKSRTSSGKPENGEAHFTVETALLEELGERLVSRPEVALSELIKNAFDADSPDCRIELSVAKNLLRVSDSGIGMTKDKFLGRWMSIGTKNKAKERYSEKYRRPYAGSKGVGRFAARFLGPHLTLTSVAYDSKKGANTTLSAVFDWQKSSKAGSLETFRVPYSLTVTPDAKLGTTLEIKGGNQIDRLSVNIKDVRNAVFKLTNPLDGLEQPPFYRNLRSSSKKDPGFSIEFIGGDQSEHEAFKNLQANILDRFFARARVEIKGAIANIRVDFRDKGVVLEQDFDLTDFYPEWEVDSHIFCDIRYFPKRQGTFNKTVVDGRLAGQWLRENGGVAVVDNKFRVVPYGQAEDDWLKLDADIAVNRRKWRSALVSSLFPMPPTAMTVSRDNPMLYLPQNSQLVGAVFVAPNKKTSGNHESQLVQAVNREGYLNNAAFQSIRALARSLVEIIAYYDHKFVRDGEEREYRQAVKSARGDIALAIKDIAKSKVIAPVEKERLVTQLRVAQDRIEDAEQYSDTVRHSLEQMSLLGVLAGFLTHEFEKTLFKLEGAVSKVRKLSVQHKELKGDLQELIDSKNLLGSYLDYARLFTNAVGENIVTPFDARAQIELVLATLDDYRKKHGIEVSIDSSEDLEITNIPLAAYSGIVMNLVANAYKAVVARADKNPRVILITASLAGDRHVVTISDTGIGIPPSMRARIWDPLYSTTRNDNTSLGSGMGLGLTLVQRVVTNLRGKVELMKSPAMGFSTTFRVELPVKNR